MAGVDVAPLESVIRDELAKSENGRTEVHTPVGRIDVLTTNEVIEVKKISNWKSAMGQVMAYHHYYPTHSMRVHLYGYGTTKMFMDATEVLQANGIRVTCRQDILLAMLNHKQNAGLSLLVKPNGHLCDRECAHVFLEELISGKAEWLPVDCKVAPGSYVTSSGLFSLFNLWLLHHVHGTGTPNMNFRGFGILMTAILGKPKCVRVARLATWTGHPLLQGKSQVSHGYLLRSTRQLT